ncbi:Aste57867_21299 [Aphanomyces stellatus]|uniref:Aste57867_21299 protein n=1 Tax=Aphanomyces stellatus TaxID=120398 RepID=A0A485LJ94_9STRA|nr:hypothetical protein As57867_021230 [Aphanomyces stellatus]VFT97971.1 Aste57867_21299 [Aphanomyces stellatus]
MFYRIQFPLWGVSMNSNTLQKKREDKRFHGAFTGGFSAGYFNTVGSKEGWAPSTFQSSRSQPSDDAPRKQRIEDFMDEEDDPLLGKRLEMNSKYDPSAQEAQSKQFQATQAASNQSIPGFVVDDFIQPSRSTIGTTLLSKMGWKPGQGVGPKVRKRKIETRFDETRDDDPDNMIHVAPKHNIDIAAFFPPQKTDKYGAGFDPFVNAPEFGFLQRQKAAAAKHEAGGGRAIMTFADAIRGGGATMGHGLSALEEADDLDIYAMDTKDNFDRELTKAPARAMLMAGAEDDDDDAPLAATQICSDGTAVLPGFVLSATRPKPPAVTQSSVHVPSGWRPLLKHLALAPPRKQVAWTAAQRGVALGEATTAATPPPPPVEQQQERQLLHSQFRAGGLSPPPRMLAAITSRFAKSSGETDAPAMTRRAATALEPLVRQTRPFVPDKLLCKRFRVAVPDAPVDAPVKPSPSMRFENDILAHVPAGATQAAATAPLSTDDLPDLPPLERPAMDLFQSVFDDQDDEDDESSSSSESEEEVVVAKPVAPPPPPAMAMESDARGRDDARSSARRDDGDRGHRSRDRSKDRQRDDDRRKSMDQESRRRRNRSKERSADDERRRHRHAASSDSDDGGKKRKHKSHKEKKSKKHKKHKSSR